MPRFVAFLRGINVGGHRLKMDRLRALFAEAGFTNVSTFIASGNVIFDAPTDDEPQVVARIQAHLKAQLGYEVATYLRTLPELQEILARRPFAPHLLDEPGNGLYVTFLSDVPPKEAASLLASLQTPDDFFAIEGREMYWLRRGRLSDSTVSLKELATVPGEAGTMRNVTTLRKLIAKYA